MNTWWTQFFLEDCFGLFERSVTRRKCILFYATRMRGLIWQPEPGDLDKLSLPTFLGLKLLKFRVASYEYCCFVSLYPPSLQYLIWNCRVSSPGFELTML